MDRFIVVKGSDGLEQRISEVDLYDGLRKSGATLTNSIPDFRLLFDAFASGQLTADEAGAVVSGILALHHPPENRH